MSWNWLWEWGWSYFIPSYFIHEEKCLASDCAGRQGLLEALSAPKSLFLSANHCLCWRTSQGAIFAHTKCGVHWMHWPTAVRGQCVEFSFPTFAQQLVLILVNYIFAGASLHWSSLLWRCSPTGSEVYSLWCLEIQCWETDCEMTAVHNIHLPISPSVRDFEVSFIISQKMMIAVVLKALCLEYKLWIKIWVFSARCALFFAIVLHFSKSGDVIYFSCQLKRDKPGRRFPWAPWLNLVSFVKFTLVLVGQTASKPLCISPLSFVTSHKGQAVKLQWILHSSYSGQPTVLTILLGTENSYSMKKEHYPYVIENGHLIYYRSVLQTLLIPLLKTVCQGFIDQAKLLSMSLVWPPG